jgi:sugar/nucleoside kinase (ribokinase family)
LFVGLTTLDLVYLASHPPTVNEKIVACDYTISAGGPATNAAVAFRHLGNRTTVLSAVGSHSIAHLVRDDLQHWGVSLSDLTPDHPEPPPVSSIVVSQTTGERAVVSLNAGKIQANPAALPADCLANVDIVLIDGHQMQVGRAIAQQAKSQNIPVVIDGGSWKPGFENILPFVDFAICSANFHPPQCQTEVDTVAYLQAQGIAQIAITHGAEPVSYWERGKMGTIAVPQVRAVDTLGAGDVFHGAFCHAILQGDFVSALTGSARIAARSCQSFGTREWMEMENTEFRGDV